MSERNLFPHVGPGKPLCPPPGRRDHPLDKEVRELIESLPHHVRMYPDLYAWAIVDLLDGSADT